MDGKTRKEATPTYCNSNWHALPMETVSAKYSNYLK